MTRIHIPAASLEAGARRGYGNFEGWIHVDQFGDPIAWEDLTEEQRGEYRWMARAAFEAMVGAWPGKDIVGYGPPFYGIDLILPLPQENTNEG